MRRRVGLGATGNIPVREMIEYVRQAESAGFASFWMHETYFYRESMPYLVGAALATDRIRLATGCINPYTRHPVLIAASVATLAETAGGRTVLGIGPGFPARIKEMGIDQQRPAAGLRDAIALIRTLWQGRLTHHQGPVYQVDGVNPQFPALEEMPPIYVAGDGPGVLRVAGEVGDGFLARPGLSPEVVALKRQRVHAAAVAVGRDPAAIDIAGYVLCSVADTAREALDLARRDPFVVYMFSVMEDESLVASGFDPAVKQAIAGALAQRDLPRAGALVSDDLLRGFTATGDPTEVAARLARYAAAGMDLPILQPIRTGRPAVESAIAVGQRYLVGRSTPA